MTLEGACWKNKQLSPASEIAMSLPMTMFTWKHKQTEEEQQKQQAKNTNINKISLPVYLNDTRADFLFAVDLEAPSAISSNFWYQAGTAMSAWSVNI